jgi:hypothetical protein
MVQSRCDSAAALNMMPAAHCKATGFEITQHDLQQALAQQQPQQCPPPTGAPAAGSHDAHAQRMCLNPAEIYDHIADGGQAKHRNSFLKELVLGILAGVFIGFGFATCMIAAGQVRCHSAAAMLCCALWGHRQVPVQGWVTHFLKLGERSALALRGTCL